MDFPGLVFPDHLRRPLASDEKKFAILKRGGGESRNGFFKVASEAGTAEGGGRINEPCRKQNMPGIYRTVHLSEQDLW